MKFKQVIIYASAFLFPPLMVGILLTFSTLSALMLHKTPAPLPLSPEEIQTRLARIERPQAKSSKPRAAILMANDGTQLSELLSSYEVLSASGALDVFTVAPERVLSPTTGPLAVFPHFSFKDAPPFEILVLPSVLDPSNLALQDWVKQQAPQAKHLLILGEGARLAAQAGLLKGRQATTHFIALKDLARRVPDTQWLPNTRVRRDGNLITSEGISSSIDASLELLNGVAGPQAARATARRLGLDWDPEPRATEDDGSPPSIETGDVLQLLLRGGFDWSKTWIATLVYPGVSEMALAAALDVFPRSHGSYILTVAPERGIIASRHGLALVPSDSVGTAPHAKLLVVPGQAAQEIEPAKQPEIHQWILNHDVLVKNFQHDAPGKAYPRMLSALADLDGAGIARFVAKMIRVPEPEIRSTAPSGPPWELLLKPVLIGLACVAIAAWIQSRIHAFTAARRVK